MTEPHTELDAAIARLITAFEPIIRILTQIEARRIHIQYRAKTRNRRRNR